MEHSKFFLSVTVKNMNTLNLTKIHSDAKIILFRLFPVIFIFVTQSKVKRYSFDQLSYVSSCIIFHPGLYCSLAKLSYLSCDFISNGYRIGRVPSDSVNELNKRKLKIDQYLQETRWKLTDYIKID